jgi:hypothetical protein
MRLLRLLLGVALLAIGLLELTAAPASGVLPAWLQHAVVAWQLAAGVLLSAGRFVTPVAWSCVLFGLAAVLRPWLLPGPCGCLRALDAAPELAAIVGGGIGMLGLLLLRPTPSPRDRHAIVAG